MATLTTANSSLYLSVRSFIPVPQKIEGYATDDSVALSNIKPAEAMMGVDGKKSHGYVPQLKEVTIMLQADSPSMVFFDTIINAQDAAREVLTFDGLLNLPGVSTKTTMINGTLIDYTPAPTSKKVLQPRSFTITFESVNTVPV